MDTLEMNQIVWLTVLFLWTAESSARIDCSSFHTCIESFDEGLANELRTWDTMYGTDVRYWNALCKKKDAVIDCEGGSSSIGCFAINEQLLTGATYITRNVLNVICSDTQGLVEYLQCKSGNLVILNDILKCVGTGHQYGCAKETCMVDVIKGKCSNRAVEFTKARFACSILLPNGGSNGVSETKNICANVLVLIISISVLLLSYI